jgi:hypothetical protein
MEHASKRVRKPQLDLAWEIVDLIVTLALGLSAAYAIATGRATEAIAATLFAMLHGLRAGYHRRLR